MPTRSARTIWTGTLQQGGGQTELTTSGLSQYELAFRDRSCDDAAVTTTPEELLAAALSSCFAMQLSAVIAEHGGTPQALEVTADVVLGPDTLGGSRLTTIDLAVRGRADGLSMDQFEQAAQSAKASCPVGKALSGVTIALETIALETIATNS